MAALGKRENAHSLIQQAIATARESGNPEALGRALLNLGVLAAGEGDFERAAELSEQSLREGGDALAARVRATALVNLANARTRLGDVRRGAESAREALEVALAHGQTSLVAASFEMLADAEVARDPARAVRLLGAAAALMEEIGERLDADTVAAVRAAVHAETYERAFAEGRGLSIDDAVELALGLD